MHKEQQPIDKLFARKLEGLEGTPTPQAWNRLESRLGQKKTRKKGMIWLSYAAAAAVVLLLGALWVIRSRETPGPQPRIAALRPADKHTPATRNLPPATGETTRPAEDHTESLAQTPEPQPEHKAPATATLPAAGKTERLANAGPGRPRQPAGLTGSETQPVRRPQAPAPLPAPEAQLARNSVRSTEPAVKPVAGLPAPEEQTLVVVVELPAEKGAPQTAFAAETLAGEEEEPTEPEAAPRTRTGRLLEGLKKAKRGEFRELGLTPDHLLARFREKGEKDQDSRD